MHCNPVRASGKAILTTAGCTNIAQTANKRSQSGPRDSNQPQTIMREAQKWEGRSRKAEDD